ncbi:PIN domain nuclease [bacterium]|nr:PIN domain nuclease [bacterium]
MILVDTSVWIDLLGRGSRRAIPVEKLPLLATCPPVMQEVLHGIRNEAAHREVAAGLKALSVFGAPMAAGIFENASQIYREGRARGLMIRSSYDCLIAAVALEHHLAIWHRDRDYDLIAKVRPQLRVMTRLE